MIYLDNAATTYPKPSQVIEAITDFMVRVGGNPARAGHTMSVKASRIVYDAREQIAELVGIRDPLRVVFTANCTTAINLALRGLLTAGDHVITTSVEHNSVMRALMCMVRDGIRLSVVQSSPEGFVEPEQIKSEIQSNTRVVVIAHASNVLGCVQQVSEIGQICREAQVLLLVDSAQTLGAIPLNMVDDHIDLLAFSGHKSLYGPQGTGGLVIGDHVDVSSIRPVICGGTGSRSESSEQPSFLPDVLEPGTLNGPGIAGLSAGVRFVLSLGIQAVRQHGMELTRRLLNGLSEIPGVTIYGPKATNMRGPVVSFNIGDMDPSRVALELDERFDIMCRAGLHCAPAAHKTAGTFPRGSVRFGLSWFNTEQEIDTALQAVWELAK